MVSIKVSRDALAIHLRTYGEDDLAKRIASATDEVMAEVSERAWSCLPSSGLLALAVVRAAIAVLEGAPREPRWKRRRLKGIYPGV